MFEVSFFDGRTLQPGLNPGMKILKNEIEPYRFSQKIYWFPTSLSTSKILHQSYFPQLLQDLKNGAYIIYDNSSEPGNVSWINEMVNPLIEVFKQNKISLKNLIVLSATPNNLYGDCDYSFL